MSVRYSDRWSVRYSRSLSEVKGSQRETEAETDFEEDNGASRLFVVKSAWHRPVTSPRARHDAMRIES